MNGDPTTDPLTQEAWDLVVNYIRLGIIERENIYGHPNDELMDRVRELVEFIEKVRYNYMAVTMIMSEWRH